VISHVELSPVFPRDASCPTLQPGWRGNPLVSSRTFFPTPSIVERLTNDLIATGVAATRDNSAHSDSVTLPPGNDMPTIYIEPFRVNGTPAPRSVRATLLFEKNNDAFARFDTVNVVLGSRQQTNALDGSS